MNTGTELWLFAVSLGASALGGMLGMASGIFIVPVLTMFGHVDIRSAIGASIENEEPLRTGLGENRTSAHRRPADPRRSGA